MRSVLIKVGFVLIISLVMMSCLKDETYSGGGQSQDLAAKFLGAWNVDDQAARLNYIVTIERHPLYEDQVKLQNFADAGGTAVATILGNTLILDKQPVGSGYESEGTGSYIDHKRLKFEFILDDGIDNLSRKATFTK